MTAQRRTVIEAEATFFSDLFLQGRFAVPWHQRYYDWKVGDVRALLHDIKDAIEEKRDCYFLGTIMLVKTAAQCWEINDGQQRMVTVSLICAALCRRFPRGSHREGHALDMLFDREANSTWTLDDAERYVARISPPQNDATQYYQMIRGNTIGTNGLLTSAWTEIETFFSTMSFARWEQYFDYLMNNLEVTCLHVPPRIDPNAVYETINCRGKPLDDLDRIRNYLYSHFNASGESQRKISLHENLERIRIVLPSTKKGAAKKAAEYMRCHLQCRFGFLHKDQFYREVREAIRTQKDKRQNPVKSLADYVFALTKEITSHESLEVFRIMTATSPDPDFIQSFEIASGTTKSRRSLSVFLRELRGYTVAQPLVFALLIRYIRESDGRKKRRLARIANRNLSRLATFVLRTAFVAPKFEPSHFEREFSDYAKEVTFANEFPDTAFADFLRGCDRSKYGVLDDFRFQSAIVQARMTGAVRIRQFLLGINGILQSDARLLNERYCRIEHIFPDSPKHWSNWEGFKLVDGEDWVDRIGNLTLMGPTDNKPDKKYNGDFAKKRESYRNSGLKLTRELGEFTEWTPDTIETRQRTMAKRAMQVWQFV